MKSDYSFHFSASCPDLKLVFSEGETKNEKSKSNLNSKNLRVNKDNFCLANVNQHSP